MPARALNPKVTLFFLAKVVSDKQVNILDDEERVIAVLLALTDDNEIDSPRCSQVVLAPRGDSPVAARSWCVSKLDGKESTLCHTTILDDDGMAIGCILLVEGDLIITEFERSYKSDTPETDVLETGQPETAEEDK